MKNHPNNQLTIISFLILSLLATIVLPSKVFSQSTPMPSSPSGSNAIVVNGSNYYFLFNGDTLYKYTPLASSTFDNSKLAGATFNGIQAKGNNGQWFWPSYVGGFIAEFGSTLKYSWESDVYFDSVSCTHRNNDTIIYRWRMRYNSEAFDFEYKLNITGRTLVIRVMALNSAQQPYKFTLDRSEQASATPTPIIVKVPYLTLFNLLSTNSSVTSLFFDWEVTNCSRYEPPFKTGENFSSTSVRFGPEIYYLRKTNGLRNSLKETIYLTVSPDLDGALPNLPGSVAPRKDTSANRIVLSYHFPFPVLMSPPSSYEYLDSIKNCGVDNVAVIIKDWQYGRFDHKLPAVLPPSDYNSAVCNMSAVGYGGMQNLIAIRNKLVNLLNYDFAVHENYADYYPDASSSYPGAKNYQSGDRALLPNSDPALGFLNCSNIQSYRIKPSKLQEYASTWSGLIRDTLHPNWSYLDVHSAMNPSGSQNPDDGVWNYTYGAIDYEASSDSAGMFLYALHKYRELPGILRNRYQGPVQGEGGNQMLYTGYFDDFEGRIKTADYTIVDQNAPLLVNFALNMIHPKSNQHGVGHIGMFLGQGNYDAITQADVQKYVATELAYGHGGLVTKAGSNDQSIYHATLEHNHVFPMQQAYMGKNPTSIQYWDDSIHTFVPASDYVKNHPGYWNPSNAHFMGRVKVTYNGSAVVCVNRSSSPWRVNGIGVAGGWFTQNTTDVSSPKAGTTDSTSFELKAYCGWVGYNPSWGGSSSYGSTSTQAPTKIASDLPTTFGLAQNYPNPFNPTTIIKYDLPIDSRVSLKVYDVLGREVVTLVDGLIPAGYHEAVFNSGTLTSGVYFYRIEAGSFIESKKLILLR